MKLAVAAAFALLAVLPPRAAHAIRGWAEISGWAPAAHAILPPHPKLVYYEQTSAVDASQLVAKIGDKRVKTKVTSLTTPGFHSMLVDIDSDATGTLAINFRDYAPTY